MVPIIHTMFARTAWEKLKQHFRDPLLKNSFFLAVSRIFNAGCGFVFWMLAARLYSIEDVGLTAALVSLLNLAILFSCLGFDFSLIRFFPVHDKNKVFNTCFLITTLSSLLIGIIFVIVTPFISPGLPFLHIPQYAAAFISFAVLEAIVAIAGTAFLAMRKGAYYLFLNILLAARIPLLIPFVPLQSYGIFSALGLANILASVIAFLLLRNYVALNFRIDRQFIKDAFKFSAGNYLSNVLAAVPGLIFPIVVLNLLGKAAAAQYYIAFAIGNLVLIIPNALGTSLFVEGSHGESLKKNTVKAGLIIFSLLVPAVILVYFSGNFFLGLFGDHYQKALTLLRLLVLSSFFVAVYTLFIPIQNVRLQIGSIVKLNFARFIIILTLVYPLTLKFGIIGVGYGWLISHGLLALGILVLTMRSRWLQVQRITINEKGVGEVNKNIPNRRFELTAQSLTFAFPVLAAAGVAIPLLAGQTNLAILGSYLAVPMFCAPLLSLKYRQRTEEAGNDGAPVFLRLVGCYLICFAVSLLLLDLYEVRTIAYYPAVTGMFTMLLLEILLIKLTRRKTALILLQISALMLNIIWGVTLKYHFFIGRTDLFGHVWMLNNLIEQGLIGNVFEIYQQFPLWHVLSASFYYILDLSIPPYRAMFLINGLVYLFLIPAVYLLVQKIFGDRKIALLSALLTGLDPVVAFYGMYSIPRSVVSFLEVILFILLLDRQNPKKRILSLLMTGAIILYHTASIPFILLMIFMIYALERIYGAGQEKKFHVANYLILTTVMILTYWMYSAEKLVRTLVGIFVKSPPTGIFSKAVLMPFTELLNYLHYAPLFFLIIFGILWSLRSRKFSGFAKIILLLGLLATAGAFPGPSMLLNKLAKNFNLARLGEYTFFLISTAAAVGLAGIFGKSNRLRKSIIVTLFIVMSFLSVSNDFVASDNPLVKRAFYTYYLTEEELAAFDRVAGITGGYLMSDYVTIRYLESSRYRAKSHILEVNSDKTRFLRNSSIDLFFIRKEELHRRPLMLFSSKIKDFIRDPSTPRDTMDYYYKNSPLWRDLERYDKVYESNGTAGFN